MSKRKRLIIVFSIFFLSVFLPVNFIRKNYVVPIIMYHSISVPAPAKRRVVSIQSFERQMRFLKNHRYNVLPLEELAVLIKDKKKIPPRTLAITFDDGYKNNYNFAFPILKRYNLPATVFVIINEVNRPDRLSWKEIRAMQNSGIITFGSHTLGPQPLTDIKSEAELKSQIFNSKKILEDKLGRPVNMFSYPGGRFNAKIRELVMEAGYKLAVTTSPGKKFPDDDLLALKRLRISSTSDSLFVFWIETTGFYTFIKEHRDED